MTVAAKPDYLVYGRGESAGGTWDFFKSVDGVTWTEPSGWTGLTMGRAQLARSGADFILAHANSYGVLATTAFALSYRRITTSIDQMGEAVAFSDTNGNPINVPLDTGTSTLRALYRGSTGSPFTVRSDFATIAAASDVTAADDPPIGFLGRGAGW